MRRPAARSTAARPTAQRSTTARSVAQRALQRIETEGAYANLALRGELDRSGLDERDRHFVTELVYGATRMRRACDHLVDRFLLRPVDDDVRTVLRLGAYQLHFTAVPPHAAVSETVGLVPRKVRGLVNAVLRRVVDTPVEWPSDATRLSYPDWIVDTLTTDLGRGDAFQALEIMNEPPTVTVRDDDYVQDLASQWVAGIVGAQPGERVADLCAAPGGKSTLMAGTGVLVVAVDVRATRASLVAKNARRRSLDNVQTVVADGRRPPFGPGTFDRVLVDAPCSGLGTLRRRADARWRIDEAGVERLVTLQRELIDAAVTLLRPGGVLVYSVCTLTASETLGVDAHLAHAHPTLVALDSPGDPWRAWGRGALLLPQAAGTDGMFVLRLRAAE
ncbi:MAG TPA: transcription antitermination factor NusB [Acidimicrobiales bacterium]|jgi:16S rRNA (cytosine967-C5)-methyltransferase